MRFLKKYFYYTLFLLLFILSMRGYAYRILLEDKIIGHNWDWSFPATSYFFRKIDFLSRYLWLSINLGSSNYMRAIHLIPETLLKYSSYLFSPPLAIAVLFLMLLAISFRFYKLFLDKFLLNKTNTNYLPSLLYTFSPFLFNDIIAGSWYMWVSFAFAPVYLYFLFSYFSRPRFIYIFFASFSLIFVLASPHNFVLLHFFILTYLIYKAIRKKPTLTILTGLFKVFLLSVILLLYWILDLIYSWQTINATVISNVNFNTFLDVKVTTQSLFNIMSLSGYLNRNMYYFSLPEFLKFPFNISVVLVWGIIIASLAKNRSKKFLFVLAIFLFFVFFIKGENPPFGEITMWFFNKFPIFKLYRGPQHLMYIAAFLIPLLIALAIKNNKMFKTVHIRLFLLVFILIWTAGWWYSGDVGYESLSAQSRDHIDFYKLSSGLSKVYLKNETLSLNQRFLFLPSVFSPIYLANEYQGQAQGGIPEYIYLKNPTFTSESVKFSDFIDTAFCKNIDFNFLNYLSLFSVDHLVVRADIVPIHTVCKNIWQADVIQEKIDKLALSKNISKKLDEKYTKLYKSDPKFFLPHFYTPSSVVISDQRVDSLPQIVSEPDYKVRSAIFFSQQITDNIEQGELEKLPREMKDTPILEFKKINPTKYRVRIHQAKDTFPLVFSESFHEGWKVYIVHKDESYKVSKADNLINYKILDGNEEDQASKEELSSYITNGWVATLGNGEKNKIDFVSKNFQDTIQNDNLPSGSFYETWFKKPISDNNHLMVNGYANSWIIDPKDICEGLTGLRVNGLCRRNQDGSYDMELVVEFWPQRLFYIGLGISGVTLLGCVGYLVYDWRRKKYYLN